MTSDDRLELPSYLHHTEEVAARINEMNHELTQVRQVATERAAAIKEMNQELSNLREVAAKFLQHQN